MAEGNIATLEGGGLEAARSCLQVGPNASGNCQCVRYGPPVRREKRKPGEPTHFVTLCRRADLPVVIGGRKLSGLEDNMARALPPPMDFPPIEDYDDDLGFFEQLIDPEMLKESVVNAGGGALGGVVYQQLLGIEVERTDEKTQVKSKGKWLDKPWKKMLTATVLGLAGGRALWNQQRDLAKGHMGAMGAMVATEMVVWATTDKTTGKSEQPGFGGTQRLSAVERHQLMGGGMHQLREVDVEDEPTFAEVEVEDEVSLGDIASWIGG